jgi:hypothetical protein
LLILAIVLDVVIGVGLLLAPEAAFEFIDGDVPASKEWWQAAAVLRLGVAAALCLALTGPQRYRSLLVVAAAVRVAGAGALVWLGARGDVSWAGALACITVELGVAAMLWLAERFLGQRQEQMTRPEPDPRRSSTTMMGLQQSLQALAAPANVQLSLFPDIVSDGDRVKQEFSRWREQVLNRHREQLNPGQSRLLVELEECLQAMLAEASRNLWTQESLRDAPEWGRLRALSRRALVAFSWSVDLPMGALRRAHAPAGSVDMRRPGHG